MKAFFTRFAWLGSLLLLLASAAPLQGDGLAVVRAAFANGSSHELSQYLASSVEVGFDGDSHSYNATQTELVIKNFFAKNPPTACELMFQGASNDGIPYVVYRYGSRSGTYRVFVRLRAKQNAPVIENIDFTKQ